MRAESNGTTHWDGCASCHAMCAILLLRDMLAAVITDDSPTNRANAEKILATTKGWEPQEAGTAAKPGVRRKDARPLVP